MLLVMMLCFIYMDDIVGFCGVKSVSEMNLAFSHFLRVLHYYYSESFGGESLLSNFYTFLSNFLHLVAFVRKNIDFVCELTFEKIHREYTYTLYILYI